MEWSWDAEASTAHPGNFQVLVQALNVVRDNMDRCQKIPVSSLKSVFLRCFFFLCYTLFMHLIFLFDFFIVDFFHDFVENIISLSHSIFSHSWHVFVCLILYLFIHLFIYSIIYLFIYLHIYLFRYVFIHLFHIIFMALLLFFCRDTLSF